MVADDRPHGPEILTHPLPAAPPRVTRAAVALVALLVVVSLVGSAFAPVLLVKYPLLLVALSPDARHVALAVPTVSAAALVSVAVLRRLLFSVGSFGLGAAYGSAAVTWVESHSPRLGKVFRLLERLFARWGAAILVVWPFGSACILAGAARTPFARFLAATLVGHSLWVGSVYLIGGLIAEFTEQILAFLSAHLVESTAVCVGIVVAHQLWRRHVARRQRTRERPAS